MLTEDFIEPAQDFSNACLVLADYHQSFLLVSQQLITFDGQLYQQKLTDELIAKAHRIECFFQSALLRHHYDEEHCLFPYLNHCSELMDGMVAVLTADHRDMEEVWQRLSAWLKQPKTISKPEEFSQLATIYTQWLTQHIQREDDNFLPAVNQLLTSQQLAEIGQKMANARL